MASVGTLTCALVPGLDEEDLFPLAERVVERVSEELRGPVRGGVGRPVDAGEARRSFHEARCALEALSFAAVSGGRQRRTATARTAAGPVRRLATYRELGTFQLLLSLQDDEALRLFCDSILGPIEQSEGHYGGELMRSLEAFIEENGQWERAARRLYCHRHTLRYRIRRVEELTGRNLGSARDRIEFWLALRGRELVSDRKEVCVKVGVPTEVKPDEYRVALTPSGVRELVDAGHEVFVQHDAGVGLGDPRRRDYEAQGAQIVPDAAGAVRRGRADRQGQGAPAAGGLAARASPHAVHLSASRRRPELTRGLMDSGATCIAYETVEDARGRLPLLAPMSEVAGKIATQAGAFMLEKPLGGRGILLGGVPGVAAANVMVIGGGVVGMNAAFIALGMEATVYVFDRNIDRLRELDIAFGGRADTCFASTLEIEQRLPDMDLVIGAVLVHGARAPHVVTRAQLALMKPQAVLVDVSIDQGGLL